MKGYLQAKGLNIHWERIRSALWKLDPEGMILRSVNSNIIDRRKYYVPGTSFLWHIYGNHKLTRWGFIIHGGIDGYSRRIMYLHCSLNNRASTVLALYMEAVQNYGLPSKVRADHGSKNNFVAAFMKSLTVVASSQEKAVIISELSGCGVVCLLVVIVFFIACSCFWRRI